MVMMASLISTVSVVQLLSLCIPPEVVKAGLLSGAMDHFAVPAWSTVCGRILVPVLSLLPITIDC